MSFHRPEAERAEMMDTLARQLGRQHAGWIEGMMRRRSEYTNAEVQVGPLRVEKSAMGGFMPFVDRVD